MWWFARLARRFGVGRLLVTGALLFSVRAGLAALAGDPLTLLATAPFAGVAMGLFYVGAVNLVAERAPGGLAATAQGLFSAVLGLATIVGSATGGLLAGALSIPGLFGICDHIEQQTVRIEPVLLCTDAGPFALQREDHAFGPRRCVSAGSGSGLGR